MKIAANNWTGRFPGGLADDRNADEFDAMELARGVKVELEHTHEKVAAMEIAIGNLTEDPDYYKKLLGVEKTGGLKVPKKFKLKKAKVEPVDVPKSSTKSVGDKIRERAEKFMKSDG